MASADLDVAALERDLRGAVHGEVDDEDAKRLSLQTLTLNEFLVEHAEDWDPPPLHRRALVHGHCHQEAVMGMDADREVLERLGLDFEVLDSGCCGLAASFGFEARHHDISVAIGEHRLLAAVRDAGRDTLIVADGFSCQTQVEQLTDRRPLHISQVIRMAMEHGPDGPAGNEPERGYPDVVDPPGVGSPPVSPARWRRGGRGRSRPRARAGSPSVR